MHCLSHWPGCALLLSENNGWKTIIPWTANSNVKQGIGAENLLTAEISDRSIRLYINGKYVNSALATSMVRGYVGLYAEAKINTAFRHVRIGEFYRSGRGNPPEPVLSVEHKLIGKGIDRPDGRDGDCVYGRSGDYVTVTRLPSNAGDEHCSFSARTKLKNVEGDPAPEHLRIETTARLLDGSDTSGYGIGFSISYTGLETEYFLKSRAVAQPPYFRCKAATGEAWWVGSKSI